MTSPRDVLAERISQWAGESGVYDFADRLLKDLDTAGYEVVAREESLISSDCDRHKHSRTLGATVCPRCGRFVPDAEVVA